jgi:hypothetical protein
MYFARYVSAVFWATTRRAKQNMEFKNMEFKNACNLQGCRFVAVLSPNSVWIGNHPATAASLRAADGRIYLLYAIFIKKSSLNFCNT